MTKIYLVLTNTNSILSKFIRIYTRDNVNHASIALDNHLEEMYSFGRVNPKNPFIGGFIKEEIGSGLLKDIYCEIYEANLTEEDYRKVREKLESFYTNKEVYDYNFIGLLAIPFKKEIKRNNKYFCSQFIATLISNTIQPIEENPAFLTPKNLVHVYDFTLIYQGSLLNYKHKVK